MNSIIGSCSLCGGDVVVFRGAWSGIIPPTPYCGSCGAVASNGPVIPMRKPMVTGVSQHTYNWDQTNQFYGPGLIEYEHKDDGNE